MVPEDVPPVTDGRALTTDRDRRHLARADHVSDSEHYQVVSRVRRRIRENLDDDVALLSEYHPNLLAELQDVVCSRGERDKPLDTAIDRVLDTFEDLNRVRGQRDVQQLLGGGNTSGERFWSRNGGRDRWIALENGRLEAALEHIDAARGVIADEIERSRPDGEQRED